MSNYKELVVWQRSFSLVKDVYLLSAKFPSEEKFGLISQMAGLQFPFPPISPKAKLETLLENLFNSSPTPKVQLRSSILNSGCR